MQICLQLSRSSCLWLVISVLPFGFYRQVFDYSNLLSSTVFLWKTFKWFDQP